MRPQRAQRREGFHACYSGLLGLASVVPAIAASWALQTVGAHAFPFIWITLGLPRCWAVLERTGLRSWRPSSYVPLASLHYLCLPTNPGVPNITSPRLTRPAPLDPERLYLSVFLRPSSLTGWKRSQNLSARFCVPAAHLCGRPSFDQLTAQSGPLESPGVSTLRFMGRFAPHRRSAPRHAVGLKACWRAWAWTGLSSRTDGLDSPPTPSGSWRLRRKKVGSFIDAAGVCRECVRIGSGFEA